MILVYIYIRGYIYALSSKVKKDNCWLEQNPEKSTVRYIWATRYNKFHIPICYFLHFLFRHCLIVNQTYFQVSNLGPPHGVCEDKQLEYFSYYGQPECYMECLENYIVGACGCKPTFLPGMGNIKIIIKWTVFNEWLKIVKNTKMKSLEKNLKWELWNFSWIRHVRWRCLK